MRTFVVALGMAATLAAPAAAAVGGVKGGQCFRARDYQGFRPVDAHAFIMRTVTGAYFRIDTDLCPELVRPGAALVTVVRWDSICGPLDWDLRVGTLGPGGYAAGCIVKAQRRLTPAEVAALPPGQKP